MATKLFPLTLGLLGAAILMESFGAPYRLIEAVVILGAITLFLQLPDTVNHWHRVRDQSAGRGPTDDRGRR
jgi:hypothetical protein